MRWMDAGGTARRAGLVSSVVAGLAGLTLAGCASPASSAAQARTPTTVPPATSSARIVHRLERPGALAVGPGGQLYVADDGLNEILQVLPGGRFRVIAG
jgi:hypothetical protein